MVKQSVDYLESLARTVDGATDEQIAVANLWYREANEFARQQSSKHALPLESVCGIIGALSPACKWDKNKVDTDNLLSALRGGVAVPRSINTFGQQVEKAVRLYHLCTDDWSVIEQILGDGIKTRNFARAIHTPEGDHIVVDRWISRAAGNGDKRVTNYRYKAISDAIVTLAGKAGMNPQAYQALIWVCVRAVKLPRRRKNG